MLKDYLDEQNISLYSISKKTNISYSTLNYIANGKIDIKKSSLENALKISECLGISIDELCLLCNDFNVQNERNLQYI